MPLAGRQQRDVPLETVNEFSQTAQLFSWHSRMTDKLIQLSAHGWLQQLVAAQAPKIDTWTSRVYRSRTHRRSQAWLRVQRSRSASPARFSGFTRYCHMVLLPVRISAVAIMPGTIGNSFPALFRSASLSVRMNTR